MKEAREKSEEEARSSHQRAAPSRARENELRERAVYAEKQARKQRRRAREYRMQRDAAIAASGREDRDSRVLRMLDVRVSAKPTNWALGRHKEIGEWIARARAYVDTLMAREAESDLAGLHWVADDEPEPERARGCAAFRASAETISHDEHERCVNCGGRRYEHR